MKPVLFVVCFTTGLVLMVASGYVPKSATASEPSGSAVSALDQSEMVPGDRPRPVPLRVSVPTATDETTPLEPTPPANTADAVAETPITVPAQPKPITAAEEMDLADESETAHEEPAAPGPEPVAEAGSDQVVWVGWNELRLDGRSSTGEGLSFTWKQTAGPTTLAIDRPNRPTTVATGLPVGADLDWSPTLYEFELTVTDTAGRPATDSVVFIVLTAPELTLKPRAERRFELRDGYYLAHFEAWQTNTESYEVAFEIKSPTPLTFTPVSGGEYELTSERVGNSHVYYVVVFATDGVSTSWVEFLVDTDERVPGVVQFGVSWDGRIAQRGTAKPQKEPVQ